VTALFIAFAITLLFATFAALDAAWERRGRVPLRGVFGEAGRWDQ